jgi:Ca-activated chloride channel family protein
MRFKILCFLLILSSNASISLFAQIKTSPKKDDDEVLRVDTQLVDVPIVVNDKTGKPLLNLKQSNFIVYEDGARQEIADFSTTTAPFEVALLLDTSGSTRSDLPLIQRAAESFIASLRPGDRVSIIAYKTGEDGKQRFAVSDILSGLTDNRTTLKAALEKVSTSNGTPYYDSLLQVVEKVFREKPKDEFRGRRALVALTDGVDSTSKADFDEAKEDLEKSGVICFFIQVDTREFFEEGLLGDCLGATRFSPAQIRRYYRKYYPKADIEKVYNFCQLGDFERLAISKGLYDLADAEMDLLAKSSGGKVFPVADLSEARGAFRSVADEIGTKYNLGYYSSNEKRDGTYRKIRVELKGLPAGMVLRAREGYTAPTN